MPVDSFQAVQSGQIDLFGLFSPRLLQFTRQEQNMDAQVALPGFTVSPDSTVRLRLEITSPINISAFVARQRANRFLITHIGDQLGALTPELVMGDSMHWRVAVQFAPSRLGVLGVVGHLLVDARTGEVAVADGRTVEDLMLSAEALYERAALPARA